MVESVYRNFIPSSNISNPCGDGVVEATMASTCNVGRNDVSPSQLKRIFIKPIPHKNVPLYIMNFAPAFEKNGLW